MNFQNDIQYIIDAWKSIASNRLFIHPMDEKILSYYTHRFPTRRVPEPWFGQPNKASIFVLTLNPGHGPDDDNHDKKTRDFFWSMMNCKATYGDYTTCISQHGINWAKRNYGDFLKHSMSTICNLRLVAYPSQDKAAMGNLSVNLLPTAKLMKDFVHSSLVPAARDGKCLLLVMRSPSDWGFGSPKADTWDNGLFVSRSLRTASITPNSRVGPAITNWLNQLNLE